MAKAAKAAATRKTAGPGKARKQGSATPDAIALLRADHLRVSGLFADYFRARTPAKKQQLVAAICTELSEHAQLEDEIFYPAVKLALKDASLVSEAAVEHASVESLMADVEGGEPGGELYEARIRVLSAYVERHVREEQGKLFPRAKAARMDLTDLGARLASRKAELVAQRSGRNEPEDEITAAHPMQPAPRRSDGGALPAGWRRG